ncbi:MAG TPA: KH domain-containing protein [Actinomycetota bacterium]
MSAPRDVLEYIARGIVDEPEAVQVTETEDGGMVTLHLTVAGDDLGKVIGRHGRTARAIRSLVRVAGMSSGVDTRVEILE